MQQKALNRSKFLSNHIWLPLNRQELLPLNITLHYLNYATLRYFLFGGTRGSSIAVNCYSSIQSPMKICTGRTALNVLRYLITSTFYTSNIHGFGRVQHDADDRLGNIF